MIKNITSNDSKTLATIHKATLTPAWSAASFDDMLNDSTVAGWKIQESNIIKGFIFVRFIFDEAEILTISVNPPYQRQGLGEILLTYAQEQCQKRLVKKIFLEVEENNIAATSLYKKYNFTIIDVRKNYYKISPYLQKNALVMIKNI